MSALAKAALALRPRAGNRRVGPIGIDFALESLHLVQLESIAGAPPTVCARASLPFGSSRHGVLSDADLFRALIRKALTLDKFHGRKAVMAVPSGLFRTLSVNYKSRADHDDGAAILRVMAHRLERDLSNFVLDYLPVRSRTKGDEKLALVAVSERKPVIQFLECARKARLSVEALEIGPVAISRLVGLMSAGTEHKNVLVINSGREASYLTLISGADLLFDQQVSFGENELVLRLAETLDMTEDMARDLVLRTGLEPGDNSVSASIDDSGLIETMSQIVKPQFLRLVDEIRRVCLYAAAETRGGSVSQVYLLGSIAHWPGSASLLSSMTNIEISKIPDPLRPFARTNEYTNGAAAVSAPEIAVATGLALRGFREHD